MESGDARNGKYRLYRSSAEIVSDVGKAGMNGDFGEQGQTRPFQNRHSRAFHVVDVVGRTLKCGRGFHNNSKLAEVDARC